MRVNVHSVSKLARIAYEAYCESVGGKSIHGEVLQPYTELSTPIRRAWEAAAAAVSNMITEER